MSRSLLCIFLLVTICSCNGQKARDSERSFLLARKLAYESSHRPSALDSALYLTNQSLTSADVRKQAIDLKIRILTSMEKYNAAIDFIDSLQEKDFSFPYKKKFLSMGLQALSFNAQNDTVSRNAVYNEMNYYVESYVNSRKVNDAELREIYTDIIAVKENYMMPSQINKEIEELKKKHPDKAAFFDFLKTSE